MKTSEFATPDPTQQLDCSDGDGEREASCSSQFVALGLCQLNQWALDFDGNSDRIIESIRQVREQGGFYRLGPELEVCGYSCEDHFLEADTCAHSWHCIKRILSLGLSHNCLLDIGMPVEHRSIRYNCRVFILNDKIILIRPKMFLANDGNYREGRYFGNWSPKNPLDQYVLPKSVAKLCKQDRVPFGFASIECNDCSLASESCEELFAPESPHLQLCLDGVEIFTNGSGSHHEFRKLRKRMGLILAPTRKMGGIYMYSNVKGCDSGRLYFDGASFTSCNGEVVDLMTPYNLKDVEVIVSSVNVARVRSLRASNPSFQVQGALAACTVPRIRANIWLSGTVNSSIRVLTNPEWPAKRYRLPDGYEEMAHGPACWLWDYLRRSGASGFFLAISGGADSATVAVIVYLMCMKVMNEVIVQGTEEVVVDLERILRCKRDDEKMWPKDARELCFQLLHTAYLGTKNSSAETMQLAAELAGRINSYHVEVDMDEVPAAFMHAFSNTFGMTPKYLKRSDKSEETGGSKAEDLALQSVQARCRMVMSYLMATLLPVVRAGNRHAPPPNKQTIQKQLGGGNDTATQSARPGDAGFNLVLSTGNVDESLRGYFTKYDSSSGDINPIGSMSKMDIRAVLKWAVEALDLPPVAKILEATPTAELRPPEIKGDQLLIQSDEEEMGMTYEELMLFGRLRRVERAGPVEMFELLVHEWRDRLVSVRRIDSESSTILKKVNKLNHLGGPSSTILSADALDSPVVTDKRASIAPQPKESMMLADDTLTLEKIANKVKYFFTVYAQNRHKVPVLTPSYHGEAYSCDDKRFDWRPIVYPNWSMQFRQIDELVQLAQM